MFQAGLQLTGKGGNWLVSEWIDIIQICNLKNESERFSCGLMSFLHCIYLLSDLGSSIQT